MEYQYLYIATISFVVLGKRLSENSVLRFLRQCKNQTAKLSKKKLQNKTINLPSYIFIVHTLIPQTSFFIHFIELSPLVLIEKG